MSRNTYTTKSFQMTKEDETNWKQIEKYFESTTGKATETSIIRFGLRKGAEFAQKELS